MTNEQICAQCDFFVLDNNSCLTRGRCLGVPISTVDEEGYDISRPKYPRRDSSDVACGMFKSKGYIENGLLRDIKP